MNRFFKSCQLIFVLMQILTGVSLSSVKYNCTKDIISKCQLYPIGKFANSTLCDCCPIESQNTSLEECSLCSKGFYLANNGSSCLQCPLGFESLNEESFSCTKCKKGHFKNSSMLVCAPCPPGQHTLDEGMKDCQLCPKGKFKMSGLYCQDCEGGSYSLHQGSNHCDLCLLGYFCPCPTCLPTKCPARGFCPRGSSSPLYCDWALYQKIGPNPDDCVMSQQLMGIVLSFGFLGALIATLCLARAFCGPYRSFRRVRQHLISEDSSLINDSTTDLFYTGL